MSLTIKSLLITPGLDYCMVKVGRKGSALHSKESENHQEKQKEYKAISNRLKQNSSPYGCVTDNGPEGGGKIFIGFNISV